MKKNCFFLAFSLFGGFTTLGTDEHNRPLTEQAAQEENLTAAQILQACTRVIPTDKLLLQGSIEVRKIRGTQLAYNSFKLLMDWGAPVPTAECHLLDSSGTSLVERASLTRPPNKPSQIKLFSGPTQIPVDSPSYASRIRGSDMTWLDLTLDFLWWKDVRFDDTPRGDSRSGDDCDILVISPPAPIPGCSAMRVWVHRQYHCVVQAEQLNPQGNPIRQMWITSAEKMNDRWMIRRMIIRTLNSGHETVLRIDEMVEP